MRGPSPARGAAPEDSRGVPGGWPRRPGGPWGARPGAGKVASPVGADPGLPFLRPPQDGAWTPCPAPPRAAPSPAPRAPSLGRGSGLAGDPGGEAEALRDLLPRAPPPGRLNAPRARRWHPRAGWRAPGPWPLAAPASGLPGWPPARLAVTFVTPRHGVLRFLEKVDDKR